MTPEERLKWGKYVITVEDYNPEWPGVFAELSEIIGHRLDGLIIGIEHVGSTSVPGLAAKPVIDIDVVIASREVLPQVTERLETLGYSYFGNAGIPGREMFSRPTPDVPQDGSGKIWLKHNLYVCAQNASELARHIAFRDYLRQHPEAVQEYSSLKKALAAKYVDDMDAYVNDKTDFIEGIYRQLGKSEKDPK